MFRIILMCLLTCCSSFMPLKQSESNICEDHTQVVEKKTRENYFNYGEGYLISVDTLLSEDFNKLLFSSIYYLSNSYYSDFLYQVNYSSIGSPSKTYDFTAQSAGNSPYWFAYKIDTTYGTLNPYFDSQNWPPYHDNQIYGFHVITGSVGTYRKSFHFVWNSVGSDYGEIDYTIYIDTYRDDQNNNVFGGFSFSFVTHQIYQDMYISCFPGDTLYTAFDQLANGLSDSTVYQNGWQDGYAEGVDTQQTAKYTEGYNEGYSDGDNVGYQRGYSEGYDTGLSGGESAVIFGGIMDVAFIPVNVFFLMFNYEVFGINIAGLVSALLTIAIILIIFRFITGRFV